MGSTSGEPALGRWLRMHRLNAGLSQRDLAERAKISVRALRDIEQDRVRSPREGSLRRLAAALGVPPAWPPVVPAPRATEDGGALSIAVLGPLSVRHGGVDERVASATLRRLVAVLALHYPATVGRDALIDALWPDGPPKSCHTLLHVYVRQLRQLLEPGRRRGEPSRTVLSTPGGFALGVMRAQLDLARFDNLLVEAREAHADGDLPRAAELTGQALRCWRGPLLSDVDPSVHSWPAAVAANERRLSAALLHADTALALGRFRDAATMLRGFTQHEPLHEGLHARLMLALASCGEQAAALGVYSDVRTRLDEELGIEPGPELREAYLRILRQEVPSALVPVHLQSQSAAPAPPPAVPAQLPAQVTGYVGRERQLRQLDELLAGERDRVGPMTISTIVGPAGVGKTTLAVVWAHRVRERFPDGQLFIDLRGNAAVPPLSPLAALAQFLRALGVSADAIPENLDEAAGMYRSLLAERRMLLVLDNAGSVDQVRPLFPGGRGCRVLITSRSRLSGLVAREGARAMTLDVLSPDEAHTLLNHLLGRLGRAEPLAVAVLARLCAWLPLAIRIAAANIVTNGYDSVSTYCDDLRSGGVLSGLEVDGDDQSAVRAAFDLSYLAQDPAQQRMFRLLSLIPGTDVTVPGAAALAGTDPAEAARLLRRLAETHLVDERIPGRFSMHDLLRRYADEHAQAAEPPADLLAAQRRVLEWYVRTVENAAKLLYPDMLRLAPPEPGPSLELVDHREASAWLDAERANLVHAVETAVSGGMPELAWQLADGLHGYFSLSMHTLDWRRVAETGLVAAESAGDLRARAACELSLAGCDWVQGHTAAARRRYDVALELARAAQWVDGEAAVLGRLGVASKEEGRLREALELFTRASILTRVAGHPAGEVSSAMNLGLLHWKGGRLSDAAEHYTRAVALFRELASPSGEAIALTNLGMIYRAMGRHLDVRDVVSAAVTLHRETGNRASEAIALCCLAGAYSDAGEHERALELVRSALTGARETKHRRLEANALNAFGDVLMRTGWHGAALEHYRDALALAVETNDRQPEVHALIGIAGTEWLRGAADEALPVVSDALTTSRAAGFRVYEGRALTTLATVLLDLDHVNRAIVAATEALAVHGETGHRPGEARSHLVLGFAQARSRQEVRAFEHWRKAHALFDAMRVPDFAEFAALARARRRAHGSLNRPSARIP